MKYKVEVIADSTGTWCGNGLVFDTPEKAKAYGDNLFMRWTAVREWRVVAILQRVDIKGILANPKLRREMLEGAVDFICKVEGIR